MAALEKWHDPAGLLIFVVSFACLWAAAVWLRTKPAGASSSGVVLPSASHLLAAPFLPRTFMISAGCWCLCALVLKEAWYRAHEIRNTGDFHWSVVLPESNATFEKIDMAPRTLHLLAFDSGATGKWQEEDGSQWTLYFFRWQPRSIGTVLKSRIHRPDDCLPAAGLEQVSDAGIKYFSAGNLELPFRRYIYKEDGKPLFVFFCQWEDGSEKQRGLQGSKQADRLRSVLVGRRVVGNQSLELLLAGYASRDDAEGAVARQLPAMVKLENGPPTLPSNL